MSQELKEVLLEVRDRVIRIETRMDHLQETAALVKEHDAEILKAKTTIKLMKWLGGALLATTAAIAGVFKAFH